MNTTRLRLGITYGSRVAGLNIVLDFLLTIFKDPKSEKTRDPSLIRTSSIDLRIASTHSFVVRFGSLYFSATALENSFLLISNHSL